MPAQPFRRSDEHFTSGGVGCAARVYRPTTSAAEAPPVIVMAHSPLRHASNVPCPALVQVAADDAIAPAGPARKAGHRMPHATLQDYPGGHFDPYVDPLFEAAVTAQLKFLASTVPVATPVTGT